METGRLRMGVWPDFCSAPRQLIEIINLAQLAVSSVVVNSPINYNQLTQAIDETKLFLVDQAFNTIWYSYFE